MLDQKKTSSTSRSVSRKKRPTLTEKNKEQAEEIEALNLKLDGMKQRVKDSIDRIEAGQDAIDALEHKLSVEAQQKQLAEKQKMVASAEQTILIEGLTEKIQEVEIKLASTSQQNNHVVAQSTVKMHMIAGMTLGLLPAPLFDIAALSGTQHNLLRSLSFHYGVDFDEKLGKTLVTSLVSGSLPVLAVVGLSSFVKIIPGIGTVGGGIGMTVISGAVIYATGQVFIRHFEAGGTIESFDAKQWKSYFKAQLEEGKIAIKRQRKQPLDA